VSRFKWSHAAFGALVIACQGTTEPVVDCEKLPIAPATARIDLTPPVFNDPLTITNPLFPISRLHSAVLLGTVDGKPFRTETTLMPTPKTLSVSGRMVQVQESQYVAWSDGRIVEHALDWYAQSADGAVWYLGEDVFNYENGVVADREGTWQAGRDGPAAMIMPATPRVGDVYRPENACPLVFEEVTVKAIGQSVAGPSGTITGAITVTELHMDGGREDKTFAPGYGEFFTGSGGDSEAIALAVPTDALPVALPAQVTVIQDGAMSIEAAASSAGWTAIAATLASMNSAWTSYRTGAPPLLATAMTRLLASLATATTSRNVGATRLAAIEVARAVLDFRLRYRPVSEVDRARLDLWAAQVVVDAAASNAGFVRGDVVSLGLVRDRFAHTLAAGVRLQVDGILAELRAAAQARNLTAASAAALRLRAALQATS
jgi:hypothetical protein